MGSLSLLKKRNEPMDSGNGCYAQCGCNPDVGIPVPEKVVWKTKCIQEEGRSWGTVFCVPIPGKAYQRAGVVFTPEHRELPVFMEPDAS